LTRRWQKFPEDGKVWFMSEFDRPRQDVRAHWLRKCRLQSYLATLERGDVPPITGEPFPFCQLPWLYGGCAAQSVTVAADEMAALEFDEPEAAGMGHPLLAWGACAYYGKTMVTISFKVRPEEARAIRAGARRDRVTVSEFLRRRAVSPGRPAPRIKLLRCPLTGAKIFGGTGDSSAPLTVEATRELLADFP